MLRRLAAHAGVVGFAVFVLIVAGLQWTGHSSPAVAAPDVTPTTEADTGDHSAHVPSFPTPTTTAITRLANPYTEIPTRPRLNVITYTVQAGDTPTGIAAKFNLRPESILWGNPALDTDAGSLRLGQVLNILPVDGVLHYAAEGDTLERLQLLYGVPAEDVVAFPGNAIPESGPYALTPGQKIVVPKGQKPIVWKEPGPRVVAGKGRRSPGYYQGPLVNIGTGTFIWPVSPVVITQYYWAGHPAIDIDTYYGQPIVASDSGTVIFSGWTDTGYGYLVILDHGNDFWTYYAHNSTLLVTVGEGVVQGQTIALSGSTGNSTGDHLDFRIRYKAGAFLDPLQFLP